MLKILLYLCCSVALGVGSGMHDCIFLGGEEYSSYTCDNDLVLEDDICFDILLHSMQFDLVENSCSFDIKLTERSVEWLAANVEPAVNGVTINLPLRAPPLVG